MKWLSVVIVSVVIGLGGNPPVLHAEGGSQPMSLAEAARNGEIEQLKAHIAKGANLNEPDGAGWTPLRSTIEFSHTEAAKLLIEGGANVNAQNDLGATPLMLATMRGQKEVVDALVAKSANVNAKDKNQRTALHIAAQMGYFEIVEALVKAGADVNAEDASRQNALSLARQRNATEIMDFLQQHGAKEPAPLLGRGGLYGDYAGGGPAGLPQGPAPTAYSPPPEIKVDPNAIKAQLQEFPDLLQGLQEVDKKSEGEQRAWAQRRGDNRTGLLAMAEKQFEEELAFVKTVGAEEKAEKTTKAVDELLNARRQRDVAITEALRDQRREALQSQSVSGDMYGRGRGGRTGRTNTGRGGAMTGPYANATGPNARATRRPDVNEPILPPETQALVQTWLNAKPEDKKNLLDTVHKQDLVDLNGLQEVATEEKAKKTTAAVMGLMMVRAARLPKIEQKWLEDEERTKKMQERYGTQGGPGVPGTMPGDSQTGTRRGTRRR